MKKITLVMLLLGSALIWAGTDPNPAEYTVNVHVSASNTEISANGLLNLTVVIEGKNYSLQCGCRPGVVFALGDYKAKLVKDEHKTSYDSYQVYEFLLPDKKTRRFTVTGQWE